MRWLAAYPPGLKILDYGCGSGVLLKRLIETGHFATGVDASPIMLVSAQKLVQSAGIPSDRFILENVQNDRQGNYLAHFYDGMMILGVLEYVDDPMALLGTLLQRVRPNGFVILSVPNQQSLLRSGQRAFRPVVSWTVKQSALLQQLLPRFASGQDDWFRYQKYHFDLGELDVFLANHGFVRQKVYYHGAPTVLSAIEGCRMVGNTIMAEFRKCP